MQINIRGAAAELIILLFSVLLPPSSSCRFMIRSAAVCNITVSTAQPGKIKLIQSRLRLLSEHFPLSLFFYRDWSHQACVCVCACVCVFSSTHCCVFSSAGRVAARPRSAARCTEWSARISGAPPAAGRKPANASPTKTQKTAARWREWERRRGGWMNER